MWKARQFREIMVAELTLMRGLAEPRDVAAALQRYWDKRDDQNLSLAREIARIAGLLPEVLRPVEDEVDELIRDAEGDSRSALLSSEGRMRFSETAQTRVHTGHMMQPSATRGSAQGTGVSGANRPASRMR